MMDGFSLFAGFGTGFVLAILISTMLAAVDRDDPCSAQIRDASKQQIELCIAGGRVKE